MRLLHLILFLAASNPASAASAASARVNVIPSPREIAARRFLNSKHGQMRSVPEPVITEQPTPSPGENVPPIRSSADEKDTAVISMLPSNFTATNSTEVWKQVRKELAPLMPFASVGLIVSGVLLLGAGKNLLGPTIFLACFVVAGYFAFQAYLILGTRLQLSTPALAYGSLIVGVIVGSMSGFAALQTISIGLFAVSPHVFVHLSCLALSDYFVVFYNVALTL